MKHGKLPVNHEFDSLGIGTLQGYLKKLGYYFLTADYSQYVRSITSHQFGTQKGNDAVLLYLELPKTSRGEIR